MATNQQPLKASGAAPRATTKPALKVTTYSSDDWTPIDSLTPSLVERPVGTVYSTKSWTDANGNVREELPTQALQEVSIEMKGKLNKNGEPMEMVFITFKESRAIARVFCNELQDLLVPRDGDGRMVLNVTHLSYTQRNHTFSDVEVDAEKFANVVG